MLPGFETTANAIAQEGHFFAIDANSALRVNEGSESIELLGTEAFEFQSYSVW